MTDKSNVKEIDHIRNHISIVFERLWLVLVVLAGIFLNNLASIAQVASRIKNGDFFANLIVGGVMFLVLLIVCGWSLLRWYKTTLTVKDGLVMIERNTINRHVNTISVRNISNINLEQNLFERILGTYKLKLDTGSLSTANKTDVKIVLGREKAFAVKHLILEMMKEEDDAEEVLARKPAVEQKETAYDIVYTQPEIIKNCLAKISLGMVFLAIAVIACGIVPKLIDDGFHISLAGLFVQILLSGSCIVAIIKKWFGDYGFRASRKQNKIIVSSGLLKKKNYEVPIDKINAFSFRATMIGRLCGRYHVVAINIGGEDEDVDGMQLLLAEKPEVLKERLAILLPEVCFDEFLEIKHQPLRVLCKKLIGWCLGITLAFVLTYRLVSLGVCIAPNPLIFGAFAACIAWAVLVIILAYRIRSTVMKEEFVIVSRGLMGRRIDLIPYDKIQYLSFRQGPIYRAMHVKLTKIHILASTASQQHVSAVYKEEYFRELKERFEETY